jgi:hypothetical protein
MPTPRNSDRRPDAPAAAADPAAVDVALCGLLQALQVDPAAVELTPDEEDTILTHLRQEWDGRVPHIIQT